MDEGRIALGLPDGGRIDYPILEAMLATERSGDAFWLSLVVSARPDDWTPDSGEPEPPTVAWPGRTPGHGPAGNSCSPRRGASQAGALRPGSTTMSRTRPWAAASSPSATRPGTPFLSGSAAGGRNPAAPSRSPGSFRSPRIARRAGRRTDVRHRGDEPLAKAWLSCLLSELHHGALSLTEARENCRRFSAFDERSIGHVRPARPDKRSDA
jgi:hypothetical protein